MKKISCILVFRNVCFLFGNLKPRKKEKRRLGRYGWNWCFKKARDKKLSFETKFPDNTNIGKKI